VSLPLAPDGNDVRISVGCRWLVRPLEQWRSSIGLDDPPDEDTERESWITTEKNSDDISSAKDHGPCGKSGLDRTSAIASADADPWRRNCLLLPDGGASRSRAQEENSGPIDIDQNDYRHPNPK